MTFPKSNKREERDGEGGLGGVEGEVREGDVVALLDALQTEVFQRDLRDVCRVEGQ